MITRCAACSATRRWRTARAVRSWLKSMSERWELVRTESMAPRPLGLKASIPDWMVYDFIPRGGRVARSPSVGDKPAR